MKKQIAVGLLVLLSLTSGNAQNLIQNGSFELPGLTGNVGSDQQERFDAYSTNITGWIVGGVGNVYLHKYPAGPAGGFGPAEDGSFYVDLSGAGTPHATVYQDFATSPGTNYVLTFYVGSSGGTSPIINIELQGAVVLLNTNVAPVAPNANGINWLKETFVFVADTNTTRLSLVDTSSSDDNSSFVDNVSVIPILPPMYQVIDLSPTLQPNNVANSYGISDDGQVTGIITTSYGQDAFLFTNGIMQDLGTLSGANGSAYAKGVNTNGQVVGYSLWRGYGRAFFYSDGVMQNAGTLGGDTSVLTAINNNGVATGYAQTGLSSNPWHAVLYSNGVMQDIGNLGYDYNYESRAYAINNSNQIVGNAIVPPSNNSHAFLYQNGLMQDLGSLPLDETAS